MTRSLLISPLHLNELSRLARAGAPEEICGILLGKRQWVQSISPITNDAPTPETMFYMNEAQLVNIFHTAQMNGQDILAFYHSHPKSDPIPSTSDIRHAHYPDIPQLIIGVKPNDVQFALWWIRGEDVTRGELVVDTADPSMVYTPPPTTSLGKGAILIASITALLILIVIALALLPPAPELPIR